MKKKKIRRCIFALWCILAIIFLIAVNIYNGNEKVIAVLSPSALFSSKARRSPLLFGKAAAAEAPAQLNTSIRLMILVFIFILLTSSNIYF